jgi:hypothetical protein
MSDLSKHICATPQCGKPATLQCPTCIKFNIKSYFCSQDCFKAFWPIHKAVHLNPPKSSHEGYLDWRPEFRGYDFTGALRPGKLSPERTGKQGSNNYYFRNFLHYSSGVLFQRVDAMPHTNVEYLSQFLTTLLGLTMRHIPAANLRVNSSPVPRTRSK